MDALREWDEELQDYPDRAHVDWFMKGVQRGFLLGSSIPGEPLVLPADGIPPNNKSATEHPDEIGKTLAKELALGRIVGPFISPPFNLCFTSPVGTTPKETAKGLPPRFRMTSDLTRGGVNATIAPGTSAISFINPEMVAKAWSALPADTFGFVIDVAEAYRLIPIAGADLHKCVLFWDGAYYVDCFLCFGVASGPALYDAFGKLLHWILERKLSTTVWRLLDDHALAAVGEQNAKDLQSRTIPIFKKLGVMIQERKMFSPLPDFKFIGIMFNFRQHCIALPAPKVLKALDQLDRLIRERKGTLLELEGIAGLLNWFTVVVPDGRAFLRAAYDLITKCKRSHPFPSPHRDLYLHQAILGDLIWWQSLLSSQPAPQRSLQDFIYRPANVHIFTDSSPSGYGAWMEGSGDYICGHWPADVQLASVGSSTTLTESIALLIAVYPWRDRLVGQSVEIHVDNMGVIQAWNKRSSGSPRIMATIRLLISLLASYHTTSFDLRWIGTDANYVADFLSRLPQDPGSLPPLGPQPWPAFLRRWELQASIWGEWRI